MHSHSRQSFGGGESNEFPRFLSRPDPDQAAFAPPPLPHDPWIVGVCRVIGTALQRHLTLSAALAIAVPAATALMTNSVWTTASAPQPLSAFAAHEEVVDAFEIVERFEQRLGYARNLTSLEQETDAAAQVATGADPLQALLSETSDPPEFHLPEAVAATAGGPVDEKAWTWAASDPAQVVTPLNGAPEAAPVIIVSQVTGESAEPDEPEVKPVVRTHHVRTRVIETIASADVPRKKQTKRLKEHVKTKVPVDADQDQSQDRAETAAAANGEDQKPGVFKKLYSWLKGDKPGQPGGDETSDGQKAGLLRQH
jgi:hypothetical protein